MVGVYKTGYLNKALGKTDSLKTKTIKRKEKKRKHRVLMDASLRVGKKKKSNDD